MNSWAAAFGLMFALDIVWALYTKSMVASQPMQASSYAAAIQMFSGALVLEYTKDPWLLIPAGIGAFAGTYIVMCGWLAIAASFCKRWSLGGGCGDRPRT